MTQLPFNWIGGAPTRKFLVNGKENVTKTLELIFIVLIIIMDIIIKINSL